MDNRLAIALYPFERGLLEMPGSASRGLVFNAVPGIRRPGGFGAELFLVQDLRRPYLALKNSGHEITPVAEGEDYDLAIVLADRHRRQNEAWIAEALARTRTGGLILIAGGKTDGIASLKKRVAGLMPVSGAQSKFHGMAFWLQRPSAPKAAIAALTPEPGSVEDRFVTGAGMFSAGEVDPGSRLLADNLPGDIGGAAADFGAGWGYLSARLADHKDIRSIDLYETSHAAIEAAKVNVERAGRETPACRYFWHDLLSEPVTERYDVIVMNPPFHQGRAAEPDIGVAMTRAALESLKKGGRLFMVANRGLPYDRELAAGSARHGELASDNSYRVLWAVK